jgi:hypothetical protein
MVARETPQLREATVANRNVAKESAWPLDFHNITDNIVEQ